MLQKVYSVLASSLLLLLVIPLITAAPLSGSEDAVSGFASSNLSDSYNELVLNFYANGNTTRYITGNYLSVPWFSADNVCGQGNLQGGGSCNIGTVNFSQYCMVSDELSQVGLLVSMSNDTEKFQEYLRTVRAINTSSGQIPSWRVLVNETSNTFSVCDSRTNSNCDTATDSTARIIISLYNVANNSAMTNESMKQDAWDLANNLSRDMLTYEYDDTCRASSYPNTDGNEICWWMKAGTQASLTGTDGSYSGYMNEAAKALIMACKHTNNQTYCAAARNTTLNYLQAAYPGNRTIATDGFRVPPGRSFKWDFTGNATPVCTNTCSPDQWDAVDAPRAFGWGSVLYYAEEYDLGEHLPDMRLYMNTWVGDHMGNTNSIPIQFYANGTPSASNQSGYKAQGWQAQALMSNETTLFNESLRNALDHYDDAPNTWDYQACFGIYGQSFSIRALAQGIGNDETAWSFSEPSSPVAPAASTATNVSEECDNIILSFDGFANKTALVLATIVTLIAIMVLAGQGHDLKTLITTAGITLAALAVALGMAFSVIGGIC